MPLEPIKTEIVISPTDKAAHKAVMRRFYNQMGTSLSGDRYIMDAVRCWLHGIFSLSLSVFQDCKAQNQPNEKRLYIERLLITAPFIFLAAGSAATHRD